MPTNYRPSIEGILYASVCPASVDHTLHKYVQVHVAGAASQFNKFSGNANKM